MNTESSEQRKIYEGYSPRCRLNKRLKNTINDIKQINYDYKHVLELITEKKLCGIWEICVPVS